VSMLLVSMTSRGRKQCFFCGEKATEAVDLHHRIPQSITRRIPRFVRREVLEEIFGKNSQKLYPLCGNCHKKLHSVLRPFEKSILLFSDIGDFEKNIVRQKMKDKALMTVSADGRKEELADVERVVAKLEKRGLGREESVQLLKDLRNDGPIYFVLPDEGSARHDPSFVNKITFDYESVMKARKRLRA
jgi:hypothetical protein